MRCESSACKLGLVWSFECLSIMFDQYLDMPLGREGGVWLVSLLSLFLCFEFSKFSVPRNIYCLTPLLQLVAAARARGPPTWQAASATLVQAAIWQTATLVQAATRAPPQHKRAACSLMRLTH